MATKRSAVKKTPVKKEPAKNVAAVTPSRGTQPNAITIRGSVEWKQWLDRFADHMRNKPTGVIDLALAKLAEQEQFDPPPKRM